jgi:DNA-binding GntR family transcriptional regulator
MSDRKTASAMSTAASQLRALVADREEGAFLGGESELLQTLGISRTTLRQVARLLEREGLLTVRRGNAGGYFACKPSFASIEAALTAYLEILDVRIGELLAMASITWTETIRQAAGLRSDTARALAKKLGRTVRSVDPDIPYRDLIKIEQGIRSALFDLIDSPYLELIFQVNIQFAARQFEGPGQIPAEPEDHAQFVAAWRSAKLLELEAITLGDKELAVLAAERTRQVWGSMMMPLPRPKV